MMADLQSRGIAAGLFGLFLAAQIPALAQTSNAEFWFGANLRRDLTKQLRLDAGQQVRFENDPAFFRTAFSEIALLYKVNKNVRVGAEYRLTFTDSYVRNRFTAAGYLRHNAKPFRITYRLKYEARLERFSSADHVIRNKLSIDYRLNKRVTFYGMGELFYRKNFERGNFDTYRIGPGLSYTPKKRHEIDIFYRYERMFNVEAPDLTHIAGVKYTATLRRKKKKNDDEDETD